MSKIIYKFGKRNDYDAILVEMQNIIKQRNARHEIVSLESRVSSLKRKHETDPTICCYLRIADVRSFVFLTTEEVYYTSIDSHHATIYDRETPLLND